LAAQSTILIAGGENKKLAAKSRVNPHETYILLFSAPTNLHKSTSHVQLLWTLND
jgi:hypothetical protein